MRVLVLSDTHAPRRWRQAPPALARALMSGPDLILHAGDVCTPDLLTHLAQYAPLLVVRGNNDGADVAAWGAPETLVGDLDGLPFAMLHDAGPREGRGARLRRRFGDASLVIFGHSHIPWNTRDDDHGPLLFNPGSPTDRRSQPIGTFGVLNVADGILLSASIHPAE